MSCGQGLGRRAGLWACAAGRRGRRRRDCLRAASGRSERVRQGQRPGEFAGELRRQWNRKDRTPSLFSLPSHRAGGPGRTSRGRRHGHPRGVWVLRARPVAGNSAPGLSLLAHVLQGGNTHKGAEGLALWCCRSAWPGRCRPAPGGSRACRAGAGGRCRGAAGRPGCAAPARPARGAAVAGRAAAGRRRAGRGRAGRRCGAAGRTGHLAVLRGAPRTAAGRICRRTAGGSGNRAAEQGQWPPIYPMKSTA